MDEEAERMIALMKQLLGPDEVADCNEFNDAFDKALAEWFEKYDEGSVLSSILSSSIWCLLQLKGKELTNFVLSTSYLVCIKKFEESEKE